jgi:LysM repeat protein
VVPGRYSEGVRSAALRKDTKRGAAKTVIASRSRSKAGARPVAHHYKVRSGDTLYRIAVKHGTTVARILAFNSLPSWKTIRPGDRIKIPSTR